MQFGGYLNITCLSLARFTLCDAQFSGTVLAGSPVSISHMESGQKHCVLPFPAVCLFQTSSYNVMRYFGFRCRKPDIFSVTLLCGCGLMGWEQWLSKTEQEPRAERRMLMGSSSRALRVHCCDRLHFFSLPILLRFGFQQLDLMICVR